jgi:hypothetical protein
MENLLVLIVIALKELNKMREYKDPLKELKEKEREAILNTLDMAPDEIYCRRKMYQNLAEAQKCISSFNADGFLNSINVARGLVFGNVKASELLASYEDRYRNHFHNIGLTKARSAADVGDINGAFYFMDQVDKVLTISYSKRIKIEKIARQNARESNVETKVIESKKEKGLLALLNFPFKIAAAK